MTVLINYNPMWGGIQEYNKAVEAIKSIVPSTVFTGVTERAAWGSEFKASITQLDGNKCEHLVWKGSQNKLW